MLSANRSYNKIQVKCGHMARADVDLWLILTDPVEARNYISTFDWNCPPQERPKKCVIQETGREITFATMSDEEAVVAAMEILRQCEIPMVMAEKNLAAWEH